MKYTESLFDFYIKNRLHTTLEELSNKVFASMLAIINCENDKNNDLSKIIKMIILEGINIDKLTKQDKIKAVLDEFNIGQTNESKEAKKCLERAKNMGSKGIEEDLSHIYGRLLLAVGLETECELKLDYNRLYERIVKITTYDLEKEKNIRLKYCYHNIYDVTEEYAYLISFLEELTDLKIQEQKEFDKAYEEEKRFYRSMPILSAVLEKTKKL